MDCNEFGIFRFRSFVWISALAILFAVIPTSGHPTTVETRAVSLLPNDLTNYEEVSVRFDEIQQLLRSSSDPLHSTRLLLYQMIRELENRFGRTFSLVELCELLKESISLSKVDHSTGILLNDAIDLLIGSDSTVAFLSPRFQGSSNIFLAKDTGPSATGELLGAVAEGVIGVAIGTIFGWTGVGGAVAAFFIGDPFTRAGKAGENVYKKNHPSPGS